MRLVFLTILLFAHTAVAFAFNFDFLNDSAITNFTQEDHTIFDAAWKKSLNSVPDNKKVRWSNPATGSNGYFVPVSTFKKDNNTCRRLKMFYASNGQTSKYEFTFCKIKHEWKIS